MGRPGMRDLLASVMALALTLGTIPLASATEADAVHTPTAVTPSGVPFKSDTGDWRGGRPKHGYFSVGTPRFFLSSKSDIGGIYVKPYFSAGYGLPHWI